MKKSLNDLSGSNEAGHTSDVTDCLESHESFQLVSCAESRGMWTLPTGDNWLLSALRWILLGHMWWQLRILALKHFLTPHLPKLGECENVCVCVPLMHSCASPSHPNRCCCLSACIRRILALTIWWIRKEIVLEQRTEDQQLQTTWTTWQVNFCSQHRQMIPTCLTYTHKHARASSKPLVMSLWWLLFIYWLRW